MPTTRTAEVKTHDRTDPRPMPQLSTRTGELACPDAINIFLAKSIEVGGLLRHAP